jgi:hypothetical protein
VTLYDSSARQMLKSQFYSKGNQGLEKLGHNSKAMQVQVMEPSLKTDLCDIRDIIKLSVMLLGCFLNQSSHPVLSWLLLRNSDNN